MPDDLATPRAEMYTRRAHTAINTWNPDARTIDVVWTTGADVARRDYGVGPVWIERLEVSAAAVDLSRLNDGAQVLDTHGTDTVRSVLGVVESARIDGGKGIATLRFSDREEVAGIVRDIANGILRNLSVGYRVDQWAVAKGDGSAAEIRTAKRWTPYELSLVAVPADPGAQVRAGHPLTPAAPPATQESKMPDPVIDPAADAAATRAATEAAQRQAAEQAAIAERTRVRDILAAQRAAGLDAEWAEKMIADGTTADAARKAALDVVASRATARISPAVQVGESNDDPAVMVRAMADAIVVEHSGGLVPKNLDQRHADYLGMRPSQMLIALAQARGERVTWRDHRQMVESLFTRSTLSTSDFPLLLANAGNKMLLAGFDVAAPTYRMFFGQRPFKDFKAHSFIMAGDFPAPVALAEGAGIAAGTISEKREQITPVTYARQVRITRQALINDDLGAFTEWGSMIGIRVADSENAIAYGLLNTASGTGPTLATDSTALFATGHANIASSGGAISESTLDAGKAAMLDQTSLDGTVLNAKPSLLVTGSAYAGAAMRYTTRISPESGANVGIHTDLTPVSDGNVTGNHWYLFADPRRAPVFVYGYVGGATGPQIRVHDPLPGVDAMAIEVVHDFAAGAVDYRGGYFNVGA